MRKDVEGTIAILWPNFFVGLSWPRLVSPGLTFTLQNVLVPIWNLSWVRFGWAIDEAVDGRCWILPHKAWFLV